MTWIIAAWLGLSLGIARGFLKARGISREGLVVALIIDCWIIALLGSWLGFPLFFAALVAGSLSVPRPPSAPCPP